jgi:hypothetical protein
MMPYNPAIHHRRCMGGFQTRPYGYDYSKEGLYFVTVCVQNHQCMFGEITNDEMVLNEYDKLIRENSWTKK